MTVSHLSSILTQAKTQQDFHQIGGLDQLIHSEYARARWQQTPTHQRWEDQNFPESFTDYNISVVGTNADGTSILAVDLGFCGMKPESPDQNPNPNHDRAIHYYAQVRMYIGVCIGSDGSAQAHAFTPRGRVCDFSGVCNISGPCDTVLVGITDNVCHRQRDHPEIVVFGQGNMDLICNGHYVETDSTYSALNRDFTAVGSD